MQCVGLTKFHTIVKNRSAIGAESTTGLPSDPFDYNVHSGYSLEREINVSTVSHASIGEERVMEARFSCLAI